MHSQKDIQAFFAKLGIFETEEKSRIIADEVKEVKEESIYQVSYNSNAVMVKQSKVRITDAQLEGNPRSDC